MGEIGSKDADADVSTTKTCIYNDSTKLGCNDTLVTESYTGLDYIGQPYLGRADGA